MNIALGSSATFFQAGERLQLVIADWSLKRPHDKPRDQRKKRSRLEINPVLVAQARMTI